LSKIPKFIKLKGILGLSTEEHLYLKTKFDLFNAKSQEIYDVTLSELLEDMVDKEVEIKVYETQHGKKVVDETTILDLSEDRIKGARELREQLLRDRYRPGYHFAIPEDNGRPGDPNGAFFGRDGRYHLMYLYARRDVKFCWGHISSHDLVHWRHHPDAIGPEANIDGCFSGGAFLDDDGVAYLSYWIVQNDERPEAAKGIAIAKSSDSHYERWENLPEVAIKAEKMGLTRLIDKHGQEKLLANADPSNIWKKDRWYYMQTGNLPILNEFGRDPTNPHYQEMRGDWVDLFKSRDLQTWEYVHRFYEYDPGKKWTDGTEDDMCPSFLPLPLSPDGGKMSGKYLQLFIAHNKGCQYYIGTYDQKNDKFIPEGHGRMSWVDNTYFAPEALIDEKGRQIMWAWLLDNPDKSDDQVIKRGWCGVYGLPRLLWLGDEGTLRQTVPPEFNLLRMHEKRWQNITLVPGMNNKQILEGIVGDSCELELRVYPKKAERIGFQVLTSPDEAETTVLYYDVASRALVFDSTKSSLSDIGRPAIEKAPFTPKDRDAPLQFRVFIDKCVVEVYLNDTQAITRRVFPTLDQSKRIALFCEGDEVHVERLTAWEMMPSNPY
jgi:beta-fructofuranosidase